MTTELERSRDAALLPAQRIAHLVSHLARAEGRCPLCLVSGGTHDACDVAEFDVQMKAWRREARKDRTTPRFDLERATQADGAFVIPGKGL